MDQDRLNSYAQKKQDLCVSSDWIPREMYEKYGVNCGLRDKNGKGVLTGLTRISKIVSFKEKDGKKEPCDGELWYRGYNIHTLIRSIKSGEFGFEKIAYLLLFGKYPDEKEAEEFSRILGEARELPQNFTRDVIMKAPTKDIMNTMTRSILTLASMIKGHRPIRWRTIYARRSSSSRSSLCSRYTAIMRITIMRITEACISTARIRRCPRRRIS